MSPWDDSEVPVQARRGQITLNLHDHLASYTPKRPAAYLHISSDRFGLEVCAPRHWSSWLPPTPRGRPLSSLAPSCGPC